MTSGVALDEKPLSKRDKFAQEVLELTNEARGKNGLKPLVLEPRLGKAAQWLAEDMVKHNYFGHKDSLGRDMGGRVPTFDYTSFEVLRESIAAGQKTPKEVVESWLKSKKHYENIMCPSSKHLGVGFAEGPNTEFTRYWVQNFGSEW